MCLRSRLRAGVVLGLLKVEGVLKILGNLFGVGNDRALCDGADVGFMEFSQRQYKPSDYTGGIHIDNYCDQ
jgi:hypothetical protein